MRVAHVNQDRGVGPGKQKGAAVHVEALRDAFRSLGCEVLEIDEADGSRARRRLEQLSAAKPIDLVYERYALGARAAADFARERGTPYILEVNAPLAWEARERRGVEVSPETVEAEADIFGAATLVFAVSTLVGRYVTDRGVAPERVRVRPNAVDPELFRPRDTRETRRRLGIPEDALVIGFHGRLRTWHGFSLLVRATACLVERRVPVHLLLVGKGDFTPELRRAGLADQTTHVEWVPHRAVGEYVACFDVLPLTYPADAPCYFSPLKLLEAMACGAVPLVPDQGDLPSVVKHAETGLVYPAGDGEALLRLLLDLAAEPRRRQELSRAAVLAASRNTWVDIAAEVLASARAAVSAG